MRPNIATSTQYELTDRRDRKADRAEQQAGDQHEPRVDAIDQESGRRLQHRRDGVEDGERQAELGVAHAIVGAHEGEQRRQHQDVESG